MIFAAFVKGNFDEEKTFKSVFNSTMLFVNPSGFFRVVCFVCSYACLITFRDNEETIFSNFYFKSEHIFSVNIIKLIDDESDAN